MQKFVLFLPILLALGCAPKAIPAASQPPSLISPQLIEAVIAVESNGNPQAVSRKGAIGLMQILPSTGRAIGYSRAELLTPEKNIEAGTKYLEMMLDTFDGNLTKALAAYNAGPGNWRKGLRYARKVLTHLPSATL